MTDNKQLSFEQAESVLEETIEKIETTPLTLREGVECYKKACEMLCFCIEELNDCVTEVETINTQIEKLLLDNYGEEL